jgi:hypothetical protein
LHRVGADNLPQSINQPINLGISVDRREGDTQPFGAGRHRWRTDSRYRKSIEL